MKKRFVFLNSLPLNMFQRYRQVRLTITRITPQQIVSMIETWKESGMEIEVDNYIRHPSTVKVLSQVLGLELKPRSDLYTYREGDTIFVASLKRPPRGQEVEATLQDIDLYLVTVEFAE